MGQRCLFHSPDLAVSSFACRPDAAPKGGEECASAHELVFPTKGTFLYHSIRGSVIGDPNKVLFFNRLEPYRVDHPAGGGDRSLILSPSRRDLEETIARRDPAVVERPERPFTASFKLSSSRSFLLSARLERLVASPLDQSPDPLEMHELSLLLLESVFNDQHDAPSVSASTRRADRRHRELAEALQLILARHFGQRWTLRQLADEVGSSPYHVARVFRRKVGTSLHEYRNRLRLREALKRLTAGEKDLTALALDCGYYDHSHFSRSFKEEFGISPSRWRAGDSPGREAGHPFGRARFS